MSNFKIAPGDTVSVVAPSLSLGIISADVRIIANERLNNLGLKVKFGANVEEVNTHLSSSIQSRVEDLHNAYSDEDVKAIFAVIGGHNCNQLLSKLDWDLIKAHPKPLIGYSDTTALQNAILAKTGHISYSGPAYSTFGQKLYFDYTLEYFKRAVMSDASFHIEPSNVWSDDQWFIDQENRNVHKNEGWLPINAGDAKGRIIGGNLGTLSVLFGTEFMPDIKDSILFLEDDDCEKFNEFDRLLQSLINQPEFAGVRGIVLGRFQIASEMSDEFIKELFETRPELSDIPVIANVDFGHTSPMITSPIGGQATISVKESGSTIEIA